MIKLKNIILEQKEHFEVKNVYLNGRRIDGNTQASSEKQAVTNIVIRNLDKNQINNPYPHIKKAFDLGGFKVKKLTYPPPKEKPRPTTNTQKQMDFGF